MARMIVTSDLHLGITPRETLVALAERIASEDPIFTILAGDIGEGLANFVACLDIFSHLPGEVAVLTGNHDIWAREGHTNEELWGRALPEAVRAAGMLWLEDAVWRSGAVAVVGSLAWYDYSAADASLPAYPPEYFATHKAAYNWDGRFVTWLTSDVAFAQRLGDGLCARLAEVEADPVIRAVLVVTHVPLFEAQMLRKPHDSRWSMGNAYFGNLTLGRRVLATSGKVGRVVSGHTHVGRAGAVPRPEDPARPPVLVNVLASDYRAPVSMTIDESELADGVIP
ncbi:MAG: metallophosphoesterase [Ktedonobacterales bacterium]|nr:metallophosphoesterase [Ktedonobacterales bacterium]